MNEKSTEQTNPSLEDLGQKISELKKKNRQFRSELPPEKQLLFDEIVKISFSIIESLQQLCLTLTVDFAQRLSQAQVMEKNRIELEKKRHEAIKQLEVKIDNSKTEIDAIRDNLGLNLNKNSEKKPTVH